VRISLAGDNFMNYVYEPDQIPPLVIVSWGQWLYSVNGDEQTKQLFSDSIASSPYFFGDYVSSFLHMRELALEL
jgi:hypothetical protein